jgi:AhpD family alkylhydroperoxidase
MFLLKEIDEICDRFCDVAFAANVVDKKTKELIAIACSVMADCVPCIDWHYQQARTAGATKEEISEAIGIAMAVSAGSKRAKYRPVIGKLEDAAK